MGQQAFVGLGAYALFAGVTLIGLDPLLAIPLAGCLAALVAAVLAIVVAVGLIVFAWLTWAAFTAQPDVSI